MLVRHSVYEKKWPVTPSELWNSKRIKRIPNTKTPIWCEKCITKSFWFNDKNCFFRKSRIFFHGLAVHIRIGVCAYMDATLLIMVSNLNRLVADAQLVEKASVFEHFCLARRTKYVVVRQHFISPVTRCTVYKSTNIRRDLTTWPFKFAEKTDCSSSAFHYSQLATCNSQPHNSQNTQSFTKRPRKRKKYWKGRYLYLFNIH